MCWLSHRRLSFGSPGRGWGGGTLGRPEVEDEGFPRARVGGRLYFRLLQKRPAVPPGAGGVAPSQGVTSQQYGGSPGRGWGGACAGANATDCARFPRARVGWRVIPV